MVMLRALGRRFTPSGGITSCVWRSLQSTRPRAVHGERCERDLLEAGTAALAQEGRRSTQRFVKGKDYVWVCGRSVEGAGVSAWSAPQFAKALPATPNSKPNASSRVTIFRMCIPPSAGHSRTVQARCLYRSALVLSMDFSVRTLMARQRPGWDPRSARVRAQHDEHCKRGQISPFAETRLPPAHPSWPMVMSPPRIPTSPSFYEMRIDPEVGLSRDGLLTNQPWHGIRQSPQSHGPNIPVRVAWHRPRAGKDSQGSATCGKQVGSMPRDARRR